MKKLLLFPAFAILAALAAAPTAQAAVKRKPAPVTDAASANQVSLAQRTPAPTSAAAAEEGGTNGRSNGIVAVVNGRPILKSELEERMAMQEMQLRQMIGSKAELDKELTGLRRKTLDGLVEQQLILKEFEQYAAGFGDKIDSLTDEHIRNTIIKKAFNGDRELLLRGLASQGLTYKKFYDMQRDMIIVSVMRGQNTRDVGYVTSQEKQEYLAKHGEEFRDGDQIKLLSISIPKVGEAIGATPAAQQALVKDIRAKLARGSDFSALAKAYSQDSKSSNGGDWGFITKKDFTPRLVSLVFNLPVKKISDTIDFEDTYYIFYVEAKKPGQMKPKEVVEPALEEAVLNDKRRKAYERWIDGLKSKATIRYFDR